MKEIHCRKDSDAVKQYFESLDALQKAVDRLYAFAFAKIRKGAVKVRVKVRVRALRNKEDGIRVLGKDLLVLSLYKVFY